MATKGQRQASWNQRTSFDDIPRYNPENRLLKDEDFKLGHWFNDRQQGRRKAGALR